MLAEQGDPAIQNLYAAVLREGIGGTKNYEMVKAVFDDRSTNQLIDFFKIKVAPIIQRIVFNRLILNDKSTRQVAKPVFKDALTLKKEGNSLAEKKDYCLALEKYDMAITVDPKIAEVWLNKGVMHKRLAEYGDTLHAFNTALKLKPTYLKEKFNKAGVLELLQQHDDALLVYKELSVIRPNDIAIQKIIENIQKQWAIVNTAPDESTPDNGIL